MKAGSILILTLLITLSTNAQDDANELVKPIVEEGKMLYSSEMASWKGTDYFLANYKDRERIGGYLSYKNSETTTCIFYSVDSIPVVIGQMMFDADFKEDNIVSIFEERSLSSFEEELLLLRLKAIGEVSTDTMFKSYNNTNLNFIPLIYEGQKKVYILTGPKIGGVVVFGNDYLITFNDSNEVVEKKPLHKNIIPIEYGEGAGAAASAETTMHSHLEETGPFITATDVCTLMMYARYTPWKHHMVVSEKYVSMWDCEKNTLVVMTKDALEKISKHQKKRQKKGKK